jgi:hypothetical protein
MENRKTKNQLLIKVKNLLFIPELKRPIWQYLKNCRDPDYSQNGAKFRQRRNRAFRALSNIFSNSFSISA